MKKVLYRKKEAASYLEISTCTLDRLRKQGLIKSKKIGGQIMFKSSEIERFLEE